MNKIRCYTVSSLTNTRSLYHFTDYNILEETPDKYYVINSNNKEIYVISKSVVSSKDNPLALDTRKPYYFYLIEEGTTSNGIHEYLEEAKSLLESYDKLSKSIVTDIKVFESKLKRDKEELSKLSASATKAIENLKEALLLIEKGGK